MQSLDLIRLFSAQVCVALLSVALSPAHSAGAADDTRLQQVIRKVAENEALYRDMEFRVETNYRYLGAERDQAYILFERRLARFLYQDGMTYFSQSEMGEDTRERPYVHLVIDAFDGKSTRHREEGREKIAKKRDGEHLDSRRRWPHMLLWNHQTVPDAMRLSVCLRSKQYGIFNQEVVFEGEEKIDDLDCLRIRTEIWENGQVVRGRIVFWLAPQRNYLPVKRLGLNGASIAEEMRVVDWKEISKGVWMPITTEATIEAGRMRRTETITDARLNPKYPVELFRNVFPDAPPREEGEMASNAIR